MRTDEVAIDAALVGRHVARRFPQRARPPLARVDFSGTDHVLYRLGGEMVVRLPLEIPEQVAVAPPSDDYPFPWSVYRWLDGEPATLDRIAWSGEAAIELARFVRAMHRSTSRTGTRRVNPTSARLGGPDTCPDDALRCPAWPGPPVLLHGDLPPTNVLVRRGRLTAVKSTSAR